MPKPRLTFADITRLTLMEADAIAFAEDLRWGGEITCHRCASSDVARLGGRPGCYRCRACARQFSVRTGTPMESSRLAALIEGRLSSPEGRSELVKPGFDVTMQALYIVCCSAEAGQPG